MKTLHEILQEPGFSPLDRAFAGFITRRQGGGSLLLPVAAAWVSRQLACGHVCLDLSRPPRTDEGEADSWPSLNEWKAALQGHPLVGVSGEFKPFLLEGHRLYLQRYGQYEHRLAVQILRRGAQRPAFNPTLLRDSLLRHFPNGPGRQALAAFAAVTRSLLILSGGPGTGKTTTALRMLAILQEQSPLNPLRFALAAPTGKAAARLAGSICAGLKALPVLEAVRKALPQEASTLHRLLGFSRQEGRRLPVDAILVDEASMVDLPLMARLFESVSESARVILLGDQEQLASVEAGSVLGDLTLAAGTGRKGVEEFMAREYAGVMGAAWPENIPTHASSGPLSGNRVVLHENYRFGNDSSLFQVCSAVREGDGEKALEVLRSAGSSDVTWTDLPARSRLGGALKPLVKQGFGGMLQVSRAVDALKLLQTFRVLTPLREGPFGLHALNALIEELLAEDGLLDPQPGPHAGMPILITRNDNALGLSNGDLGILWPDESAGGKLAACFDDGADGVRRIPPLNLPPYEKAYAMTIHKSQGSECNEVLVILPDHDLPMLTRELVYTALSRAKKRATLWAREDLFLNAIRRRVERHSGLKEKLVCQRSSV